MRGEINCPENYGVPDPNNYNWWQFGTGWPWNNSSLYSQATPWQFWWAGATNIDNFYAYKTDLDDFDGDTNNNDVGNFDQTSYSSFNSSQPWPNITSVIPVNDFVGWGYPGVTMNCIEYAKAQIAKKGYKISDYGVTGQTIQMYAGTSVNTSNVADGVGYLLSALSRGIPVIVGVDDQIGSSNPGTDNTTDHFVVITGTGTDASGNYFTFFDNASGSPTSGTSPNNKLYYNSSTGLISGSSQTSYAQQPWRHNYVLTMIRKSK